MKFLSEDGKVFNSEEECKAHESSIKNKEEEIKKKKEHEEDLYCLIKLLEEMQSKSDELDKAIKEYEKKWGKIDGSSFFSDTSKKSTKNNKKETLDDIIIKSLRGM